MDVIKAVSRPANRFIGACRLQVLVLKQGAQYHSARETASS